MSHLTDPFDLLFKHTMSRNVAVRDFLMSYGLEHVYQRIDTSSIQPTHKSYMPDELKGRFSEVVHRCTLDGRDAFLFFLLSLQEESRFILPLHIIQYKVALLEDYLQDKPEGTKWPMLIGGCYCHGGDSPLVLTQ